MSTWPPVHEGADRLHGLPKYLSNRLRVLTGQNTQQHIPQALIEKAKRLLRTTLLLVR
ncbi:hypothetical protein GCM10027346_40550 [Hymenobacter seoulensis]